MNDKVVLTQAQADGIKSLSERSNISIIEAHQKSPKGWIPSSSGLNGMPLDTLIRALYIGYEVEPSIQEKLLEKYTEYKGHGYEHISNREAYRQGMRDALEIVPMKVEGINA